MAQWLTLEACTYGRGCYSIQSAVEINRVSADFPFADGLKVFSVQHEVVSSINGYLVCNMKLEARPLAVLG